MKITKIILFFLSFILSFLLFTKDTFAERYDYDISKFVFNPIDSAKLLKWVPTDFEKFTYKNPFLKTRATIWPGKITTKAITYLTYLDMSNKKWPFNFQSIMPFFAIVNPKYLDSKAKIGIPITPDVPGWDAQYIYITPDQDEYWNTCLFLESPNWKVKEIMKNTCFSNFYNQEPFLMIFSINNTYKLSSLSSNLSASDLQTDWHNYTSIEYTLTRRAGKSPWQKEEPISLYKPDSIKLDIEDVGDEFLWGRFMNFSMKEYSYDSDLCYKNWFKQGCSLMNSKVTTNFKREGGQRFIQFYSYDIEQFPWKPFDEAGWWLYSSDKENNKAEFYQFFPIKYSFLIDQFAPFIVEQVFWEPKNKPDGKWYDFTPGQNNDSESAEKWPFKIPKFNMEKPKVPTCSFFDSFLGLSCLAEWINYGFSMIVWIITSVIDSIIDFLNYMIEFNFNFFNAFLDIFKKFVIWIFETMKNFIWPYIEPLWNEYAKPVWEFFYGFFKPLWELATMKTDFQTFFWGSQSYICQKSSWFYIDTETPPAMRPSELLGFFFYLANPIPPQDGVEICTNIWVKRLNYWRSTIIDTIVFLFFITAGLWFLFYIVRE